MGYNNTTKIQIFETLHIFDMPNKTRRWKNMAKYEMLYLLNNELTDEAKEAEIAKYEGIVTSMNGSLVSTDKWGTKKTAYPINYKTEAYYVLMTFEADGTVVEELKRVAGIDADVVRRLITKLN